MKNIFLIFILLGLFACNGKESNHEETNKHHHGQHGHGEHANHQHGDGESKHGTANEYMHQASFEELVERFESAERDAYQQPEKVMEYLGDISGKKIMDIGAGTGYFSVKLAAKGASVIAADVDEKFQDFIRERITKNSLTNIELRKIPYDSPSLANQEVDMALVVNTYHHIENRVDYFSKVKNGLKENGDLVIIDFFAFDTPVGPKHHKIPIDIVIDELKKAGFNSFGVEVNLLPYQYIIKAR